MDHQSITAALAANRGVFEHLLSGLSRENYLWKPDPGAWCLLEVLCHLYDEEREDFRARCRQVLENPEAPLPKIDPVGWVHSRAYLEQDFDARLAAFLEERDASVRWLKSLRDPAWHNTYHHPKFGPMPARLFLVNWLAHDYLHFRQITRLKYGYLARHSELPLDYAGTW